MKFFLDRIHNLEKAIQGKAVELEVESAETSVRRVVSEFLLEGMADSSSGLIQLS